MEKTLVVKNLALAFHQERRPVTILAGVEFEISSGETLALVGESGSGKTLTALSIVKLLPPQARLETGEVRLNGQSLTSLSEREMENIRGRQVGLVFQEPSAYLNPVFTIGNQIEEAIKSSLSRKEKKERVAQMLAEVGLDEKHYWHYPHQLSGGMQQRALIAMALINHPSLLIADEPTTSLDVTTAVQIISLIKTLIKKHHLALLFISHDIALAHYFADRMAVMYAGRLVEIGPTRTVFNSPRHPYTESLIACLPEKYKPGEKIRAIPGTVPDFANLPSGCPFHPRCHRRMERCFREEPEMFPVASALVRCFLYGNSVATEPGN
ncbi:MAG TPA: ABC transporter ATP-binding protein [bacterium]|nr:ABC transporter ATP-binding protein [bacterium]HOL65937.1 ABC transporter ATP-binding protein [bacterium]HPP11596.1 ABC transporter ATP-binding protein [bacterium]